MFSFKSSPFEDDIDKATDEKNVSEDWALIMHICDNATNYQDGAKVCFKAIMKRLHHNVPRVVLQALTLLDSCVKNCDRKFLLQVASSEFTNEIGKLLPKMHPSTAVKLKELIQKWSLEEFKDDPELCIIPSFYYKLVSEGVEFPAYKKKVKETPVPISTNPDAVNSQEEENDIIKAIEISLKDTGRYGVPSDFKNFGTSLECTNEPPLDPFKVRVLYDFEAAEDNELTIKAGEVVLVLDNSNSSWWKGSNHIGEGLFPSNFVTDNLDYVPEESVVKTPVQEKSSDDEQEVKLDEEKIEVILNWLNETDPSCEFDDSEEMLKLEKQCYRMAPLIEEHLQEIDNRLAMLNKMNENIMETFDKFHSLSNTLPVTDPTLKYATYNNSFAQFPQPLAAFPTPIQMWHSRMPFMPPQELPQASSVLVKAKASNFAAASDSSIQSNQLMQQAETISSAAGEQSEVMKTVSMPLPKQQSEVDAAARTGGYYVPSQAIPYPMPYGSSMVHPGFMQGAGTMPKFMTLPCPMPSVGPYFPFPCYYVNNTVPSQSATENTTTVSNSNQSNVTQASVPKSPPPLETNKSSLIPVSNYSQDLHNLMYSVSGNSAVHEVKPDKINEPKKEADVCKDQS